MMSNPKKNRIEITKHQTEEANFQIYVRRYHKTTKMIVFWFNNKAIQAIFEDDTQILINKEGLFTFVNKMGFRHYFEEKEKERQSDEVKKRLNHLYSLINKIKVNKDKQRENKSLGRNESSEKFDKIINNFQTLKPSSSSKKLALRKDFSNCK